MADSTESDPNLLNLGIYKYLFWENKSYPQIFDNLLFDFMVGFWILFFTIQLPNVGVHQKCGITLIKFFIYLF